VLPASENTKGTRGGLCPYDFESLTRANRAERPRARRIRLGRSSLDEEDEGEATGDPDAAGMGHLGVAGGGRHPRMQGARAGCRNLPTHMLANALLILL